MENKSKEEREWYMKRVRRLLNLATVDEIRNIYFFTRALCAPAIAFAELTICGQLQPCRLGVLPVCSRNDFFSGWLTHTTHGRCLAGPPTRRSDTRP